MKTKMSVKISENTSITIESEYSVREVVNLTNETRNFIKDLLMDAPMFMDLLKTDYDHAQEITKEIEKKQDKEIIEKIMSEIKRTAERIYEAKEDKESFINNTIKYLNLEGIL